MTSNILFKVLSGIYESDYASEILDNEDMVLNYAEAAGYEINQSQALKIISVGNKWIDDIGNGEWSHIRHEAIAALQEDHA